MKRSIFFRTLSRNLASLAQTWPVNIWSDLYLKNLAITALNNPVFGMIEMTRSGLIFKHFIDINIKDRRSPIIAIFLWIFFSIKLILLSMVSENSLCAITVISTPSSSFKLER